MTKTKTSAEPQNKSGVAPTAEKQPETPEKPGGLSLATPATTAVLPSPNGNPSAARAADLMADSAPGMGAIRRAQMVPGMQQTAADTRLSRMLGTAAPAEVFAGVPGTGSPARSIQRQKEGQVPKKPPPITAPLPKEAAHQPPGAAEFEAGGVKVVALPDKTGSKPIVVKGKKRDAMTDVRLDWKLPGAKHQGGKVISITPVPPPTLTNRTTYGPKAGLETKSGYGKGTMPEDIKAGKTSLGHHEGSLGEYAVQYTKAHPLPIFKGKVGMSVEEYAEAQAEYDQAMEEFQQALGEYHRVMTDCVGQKGEGCAEP